MFDLFDRLPFLLYIYFLVLFSCLIHLTLRSFSSTLFYWMIIQWFLCTSCDLCDLPFPPFLSTSLGSYFLHYFRFLSVSVICSLLGIHLTSNPHRGLTLVDFKIMCLGIILVFPKLHHPNWKVLFVVLQCNYKKLAWTLLGAEGIRGCWNSISDCEYRKMKTWLFLLLI